jgi:hypothetical protein
METSINQQLQTLKQKQKFTSEETITEEARETSQSISETIRARPIAMMLKRNSFSGIATSPPLLYNSRHRYSIASSINSGNSSECGDPSFYTTASAPAIASIPEHHKMDKRRRIMSEIVQTEIRYVTDLAFIRVIAALM